MLRRLHERRPASTTTDRFEAEPAADERTDVHRAHTSFRQPAVPSVGPRGLRSGCAQFTGMMVS